MIYIYVDNNIYMYIYTVSISKISQVEYVSTIYIAKYSIYIYYVQRGRPPAPISLESKFFLTPFSNFSVACYACCWMVENQPPLINH